MNYRVNIEGIRTQVPLRKGTLEHMACELSAKLLVFLFAYWAFLSASNPILLVFFVSFPFYFFFFFLVRYSFGGGLTLVANGRQRTRTVGMREDDVRIALSFLGICRAKHLDVVTTEQIPLYLCLTRW